MLLFNMFLLILLTSDFVQSFPTNNTDLMTGSYSKVSHWSNSESLNNTNLNEGRSNKGQIFYTHRTDAKIRSGQNLRKINTNRKTINNDNYDQMPSVGEVIQERFNPRPYFDYIPDSSKIKDTDVGYTNDKPLDIVTPDSSIQLNSDQPMNTYGSPYTSYNPAPVETETKGKVKEMQNFRPTVNYDDNVEYDTPPYDNQENKDKGNKDNGPNNNDSNEDDFTKYHYPSEQEEIKHDVVQNIKSEIPPPKEYNNYEHVSGHSIIKDFDDYRQSNEDMDLNPPPADDHNKFNSFYQNHGHFLDYDDHHHHHHVYQEVKTTTTPEPKEHERVNQAHYSYYYLGRKLFYIPLYFSVYFIVYVTVLILKSIARHKVQFVQHFDNTRNSRNIDTNKIENDVNRSIYNSSQKYMK